MLVNLEKARCLTTCTVAEQVDCKLAGSGSLLLLCSVLESQACGPVRITSSVCTLARDLWRRPITVECITWWGTVPMTCKPRFQRAGRSRDPSYGTNGLIWRLP